MAKQYCSHTCHWESQRKEVICKYCNKSFLVKPSTVQKYCSIVCAQAAKREEIRNREGHCMGCGSKFDNKNYPTRWGRQQYCPTCIEQKYGGVPTCPVCRKYIGNHTGGHKYYVEKNIRTHRHCRRLKK
jgi:hypothetical protein